MISDRTKEMFKHAGQSLYSYKLLDKEGREILSPLKKKQFFNCIRTTVGHAVLVLNRVFDQGLPTDLDLNTEFKFYTEEYRQAYAMAADPSQIQLYHIPYAGPSLLLPDAILIHQMYEANFLTRETLELWLKEMNNVGIPPLDDFFPDKK